MKKDTLIISLIITILLIKCTSQRNNPFDIYSDNYNPPSFKIDTTNTNVFQDYLYSNIAKISLLGNTEFNEFRYTLDSSAAFSDWSSVPNIEINDITDDYHKVILQTKYPEGIEIYSDTIAFKAAIISGSAVHIFPYKQKAVARTMGISLCVKDIEVPIHLMHVRVTGAKIVENSCSLDSNIVNRNNISILSSEDKVEIVALDGMGIKGYKRIALLSIFDYTPGNDVSLDCVLYGKNNDVIEVENIRGVKIIDYDYYCLGLK